MVEHILAIIFGLSLLGCLPSSSNKNSKPPASETKRKSADNFYNCNKLDHISLKDLSIIKSLPLKVGSKTNFTKNLKPFDPAIYSEKTVVFLISATWCGYCKFDISKTMEWRKKSGWPKDKLKVVHMLVPSGKQDLDAAKKFLKEPKFKEAPLSLQGIDFYYAEASSFKAFQELKSPSGHLLFPDLAGTPYAIIFDKQGVARFQGHYTNRSKDHGTYYDEHYQFIGKVAAGQCDSQ